MVKVKFGILMISTFLRVKLGESFSMGIEWDNLFDCYVCLT